MFKNSESPISLFSFQDIITTLTGIMLLFLLVLALLLMEVSEQRQKNSPVAAQLKQEQQRQNELNTALQLREKELAGYRLRLRSSAGKDVPLRRVELFHLERELSALNPELESLENRLKTLRQLVNDAARRRNELKSLLARSKNAEAERSEFDKTIARLQREIKLINDRIKEKQRLITITAGSDTYKRPLLIECSSSRIRIIDQRSRKVLDVPFITEDSAFNELERKLQQFPPDRFYYVFLIKPGAISYSGSLLQRYQSKGEIECGFEPVLENEEFI